MEKIIKENIIKNVILIILLTIVYSPIRDYLSNSDIAADKASAGDILVAISIIAVIACFGNFAFTYEKIDAERTFHRYLAHFTTGLLMLVIGTSLISTSILVSFIMGHFILVDVMLSMLYVACISYDFYDLLKASG